MAEITATGLVVKKHRQVILSGLDFQIKKGTIAGLIGPSGAGKTTLMRTLVGSQMPTSGKVTVAGLPAGSKILRSKIGYVTQANAIYQDLTVTQNLAYFATLNNVGKDNLSAVIKQVDLTKQKSQLVGTLSGGQQARVSLAIALLGKSDVIILDEPTVGLDPVLRKNLWQLFRKLADDEKTLLVSSHVMDEADHCDQILLLREGRLLWNGSRIGLLKQTGAKNIEQAFITMVDNKKVDIK